jgi:hypothetical protein
MAPWVATVGAEHLSIVAAHELGLALEWLVLVLSPGERSADTIVAMVDAVDVVICST